MADDVRELVAKFGWSWINVHADAGTRDPNCAYSIGFEETWSHPEVLIFGLRQETCDQVLSQLARRIAEGAKYQSGVRYPELMTCDVQFKEIPKSAFGLFMGIGKRYYEQREFRALQLFSPDRAGKFPWEEGADENCRMAQPDISEIAALAAPMEPLSGPRNAH
jgi:hypothetical protein